MRLNKPLNKILNSETKVKILRLFCSVGGETSGRQVAQLLQASTTTVRVALRDLYEEGVLERKGFGTVHAYGLNPKNWVVAKVLKPMFKTEGDYPSDLWTEFHKKIEGSGIKEDIVSVALFGSVHKKKERPTSDVDLLVLINSEKVRSLVEDLFLDINVSVLQEVGLSIDAHIYSVAEFRKKSSEGLSFIKAALDSNKIIWGKKLEAFL